MPILCPICNALIDLGDDTLPEPLRCPACGSTVGQRSPPADRPELPRRLGRFELLAVMGRGAFGTVYKARDPDLDRLVAVKVPHPGEAPAIAARFLREARSAAQLRHPGIVPIHEVGEDGGTPYLVSELVAGTTLADDLPARRRGPAEAARLVAALADALHYAHTRGVIHRDVKPTNIMLDAAGEPHLLDFGLARRDAGEATMTTEGQVLGTPAYMSPEQARGEGHRVDGRADIYSLGVLLYQLLTGEPPFRGSTRMLLRQVLEEEPRPPRRLNDRVPRDLETVCLKCLEKEPARRYASAQDLADDLRRFVAGRPVVARPVGRLAKLARWGRRNPALAAALAAAFLGLAAVAVVSLLFARAERENAGRLKSVNEELQRTDLRRRQALREATFLARDRGLARCAEGEADVGLLWLVRALEIGPEDDPELAETLREVRVQVAAWRGRACPPRARLSPAAPVGALAFSPDGRLLLTGSRDGEVSLWRTETGELVGHPWRHRSAVMAAVFSGDGRRFATTDLDGPARVGDAATGQAVGDPVLCRRRRLALSADGQTVLIEEGPNSARLHEADTGRAVGKTIEYGTGGQIVAFSPDGKSLLTWGQGQPLQVWEATTGRPRGKPLTPLPPQQPIHMACFSPDGRLVATGSGDQPLFGEAQVWDVETGRQVGLSMFHPTPVEGVAFSHDGSLLLTRCQDGLARFWEVSSGRPFAAPLRHAGPPTTFAFSPDGRWVAAVDESGAVHLRGAVAHRPPGLTVIEGRRVAAVAFSPDGRLLATGSWDRTARLWDAKTGEAIGEPMGHPDNVLSVAFSPDGKTLLTGCGDKTARFWDVATCRATGTVFKGQGPVTTVAFGPNGTVLTCGSRSVARLWDVATGKAVGEPMKTMEFTPALAVSPDGPFVLTNGPHPGAHLYDAATGRPAGRGLAHPGTVLAVAMSPDGRRALTTGADRTAQLWDVASGERLGEPLTHPNPVGAAAFSGDGRRMATGGWDGNARLWEVRTGRVIGPPLPHARDWWVWGVALSPDGTVLATGAGSVGGDSGEGRLWPVPAPVDGSAERLAVWAKVHTGMELDADGVAHRLGSAAWEQARRRLAESDGEPR
jgi:WD40 repeat protein